MVDMPIRVILQPVETQMKGAADRIGQNIGKSTSNVLENIFKRIGGAGGALGNLMNAFPIGGAAGAAVAGAGAVIGILKMIHDKIGKMLEHLAEASASLKMAQDIQTKTLNMVLKPIGDIMSALMRPYLMLMMRRMRDVMASVQPYVQAAAGGNEDAMKIVMEKIEAGLTDIGWITQKMNDIIKPIVGELQGFQDGLAAALNNFLTGTKEYLSGFGKAMGNAFADIPLSLKDWITTTATSNPESLLQLPKNIADKYRDALLAEEKIASLRRIPTEMKIPLDVIVGDMQGLANWFRDRKNAITGTVGGGISWSSGGSGGFTPTDLLTGQSIDPNKLTFRDYVRGANVNPFR